MTNRIINLLNSAHKQHFHQLTQSVTVAVIGGILYMLLALLLTALMTGGR